MCTVWCSVTFYFWLKLEKSQSICLKLIFVNKSKEEKNCDFYEYFSCIDCAVTALLCQFTANHLSINLNSIFSDNIVSYDLIV